MKLMKILVVPSYSFWSSTENGMMETITQSDMDISLVEKNLIVTCRSDNSDTIHALYYINGP